jgi:hypothetical protein
MQTQHTTVKNHRLESFANPPPPIETQREDRHLFQTMDDLRLRHGHRKSKRERFLHTAGAVLACLLLTALLYVAILFTG